MVELPALVDELLVLGGQVRDRVLESRQLREDTSPMAIRPEAGDVAYAVDVKAEALVRDFIAASTHLHPIVVVTEDEGSSVVPSAADPETAAWRVIIDPIDGTRELIYDKRSAWFLAGVAPNAGATATLSDIVGAVQVEIPPSTQALSAMLTAIAGGGATRRWWDVAAGTVVTGPPGELRPSTARTIRNGFAVFVDFFPGNRRDTLAIADEVFTSILGSPEAGKAAVFNDQYISSGGQMYLLASGRYRFVADIRADVDRALAARGEGTVGLCAHPYDLAAGLIATELGVELTNVRGGPLDQPLDNRTNCSWIGYANAAIRHEVEGPLLAALARLDVG